MIILTKQDVQKLNQKRSRERKKTLIAQTIYLTFRKVEIIASKLTRNKES